MSKYGKCGMISNRLSFVIGPLQGPCLPGGARSHGTSLNITRGNIKPLSIMRGALYLEPTGPFGRYYMYSGPGLQRTRCVLRLVSFRALQVTRSQVLRSVGQGISQKDCEA